MIDEMATITGDWIKRIRKALGMTQEQFAIRMGVSQATVALWESEDRKPLGPARILLEMLALEAERASGKKIPA